MAADEGHAMGIFQLTGVDSACCGAVVSKSLYKIKGVKKVRINYITQKVYVEYDPGLTDAAAIRSAIKEAAHCEVRVQEVRR